MDEVEELHRLSGRAMAAVFGAGPGFELRLAAGGALGLSGEPVADLNNLLLCQPAAGAKAFLEAAVGLVDARALPLLALMAPDVAPALAPLAARLGLTAAGSVPLMVLREPASVKPSRDCRIEAVTNPGLARIACDLSAAAFELPRESVGRAIETGMTCVGAAETFVAFADDTPMTAVTITRTGPTAGVWTMATPRQFQGRGMGRALLSRIIQRYASEGVDRFYLLATAAGRPLYEGLGFVTVAEEAAWVKGRSTQARA